MTDLFDQPSARGLVGERQTDLEDLIAEKDATATYAARIDEPIGADYAAMVGVLQEGYLTEGLDLQAAFDRAVADMEELISLETGVDQ